MSVKINGLVSMRSVILNTRIVSLAASALSVDEGMSVTFTLTTTQMPNGTSVPYTISGVTSDDINGAALTGSFTVNNNTAQVTFNVQADNLTEGTEFLTMSLNDTTVTLAVDIKDTSNAGGGTGGGTGGTGGGTLPATNYIVINNPNPYGTSEYDEFGIAVACNDTYAVIGSYLNDTADSSATGKAFIFSVADGSLVRTLSNPNNFGDAAGDVFGSSVAISGNLVVVGAPGEQGTPDEFGSTYYAGVAYVFDVTTGALVHTLTNPSAVTTDDYFGAEVAIDGNYIAISATGQIVSNNVTGVVYVYDATTGQLLHTLSDDTAATFGTSLAINGTDLLIGAPYSMPPETNASRAFLYNIATGLEIRNFTNPEPVYDSAPDMYGQSVSISANYVAIGAPGAGEPDADPSGKVYIYSRSTGDLVRTIDNPNDYTPNGTNDEFGFSTAISGDYLIVGAPMEGEPDNGDIPGFNSGKIYIFDINTGQKLQTINNPNSYDAPANDQFARWLTASSTKILASSTHEGDINGFYSGVAYLFDLDV